MWVLVILISLICFGIGTFLYLTWNFNYWRNQCVLGPRPNIFKGSFPKTSEGICNLVEELHEIYLKYKETQCYVGVFAARSPKLFILDPKLASLILKTKFNSFRDNESSLWASAHVEELRFGSPFVSVGNAWKEKRNKLVQLISTKAIRSHSNFMKEYARRMTLFIKSGDSNSTWDIKDVPMRCVNYYGRTSCFPFLRKLYPVRFFPLITDEYFKGLVKRALQGNIGDSNNTENCVLRRLLQIKTKNDLSVIEIAGHTTTVLIDGFETAAIVIANCLLMLARNQRVQTKLRQYLKECDEDTLYSENTTNNYLNSCIQETLRLFPPLATLFKICTESVTLDNYLNDTKVELRPGDQIYISSYSFHHDPTYFDEPEKYWPERFDAEFGGVLKYKEMGAFLPFGDGPRMCPGMKLALMEVKIAVVELIREFELVSANGEENKLDPNSFLLKIDGDILLKIKKIN
ncbi:probable cytochrome P450 28d1 [Musca autumnalis]|uniref:probable cytochrome P450 28d1 n=1 Tax=Musca autumnalis TaxID=221902 RepID=UPI003CEE8C1E